MNRQPITHRKIFDSQFDNLFGLGKGSKAKRAEKKVARSKLKGDKERAKLGLDELPVLPAQAEKPKNNTLLFVGIGSAIVVVIVMIFILKR